MKQSLFILCMSIFLIPVPMFAQNTVPAVNVENALVQHGTVVSEKLSSTILKDNLIGIDPNRNIKIYLPPGYATSGRAYPVLYYLHNTYWSPEKMFDDGRIVTLLEQGFANNIIEEIIVVAADYTSPTTGSLFENSPVSGRWIDYTIQEIVPFIDNRFRTMKHRNSRAVVGDFWGGRGALKIAMLYPDIFSVSYAMHPVATGSGTVPIPFVDVDWKKVYEAKTIREIGGGRSSIFVSICQAFLPNPKRPPFYCDFFMEMDSGTPRLHSQNTIKGKREFLLEETLYEAAANLRTMRGLAFDWGRFDPTPAHVYANSQFSRKLEDLGIEHEAEEYRGDPWNITWTENGRFYTRVLPFLARHLQFGTRE